MEQHLHSDLRKRVITFTTFFRFIFSTAERLLNFSFEFNLVLSLALSGQSWTKDCPHRGIRAAEWFSSYANFPVSAGPFNGSRRRVDYRRKFTGWHNFRCQPKKPNPIFASVARPLVEYPGKFINHRLRKRESHRSIWRFISNSLPPVINFSCLLTCYHFSWIRNTLRYVSWN